MGKSFYRGVASLLFFTLLTGCVLKPKYIVPGYVPPAKVAVLPMSNQSNDVRGPDYVRQEFVRYMGSKGYDIIPIQETDEILRTKFGINEGGQLNSSTPQKIGEALNVDGLVYGDLIDFKFVNIGFYLNKYVEADFKLVDVKSGQPLWEDQRKSTQKIIRTNLKEAGEAFAAGLAEKAIGNMMKAPLYDQVQGVLRQVISTLPSGR